MSAQQKALVLPEKQGQLTLGVSAIPKPGPNQLLVKVHAVGLNPVDWMVRDYGIVVETFPAILGLDGAGVVAELGEGVTAFSKGDRVAAFGNFLASSGVYQESYVASSESDFTVKIPDSMKFEDAAALPVGISTAAMGVYHPVHGGRFDVPWANGGKGKYAGKSLVVLGGSGSVGSYVTASSQHTDYLTGLGATHVIDRRLDPTSLLAAVKNALPGGSTQYVYDTVSSQDTQKLGLELLGTGGRMVLTGQNTVGDSHDGKEVVRVMGSPFVPLNNELSVALYKNLVQLLEDGSIKPNKVEVLSKGLSSVNDGLERLKANQVSGVKLVVPVAETA